MSEIDQLKIRIDESGQKGVPTAHIRDDYEPAGDMVMRGLMDSGEYVQRKGYGNGFDQTWRIFRAGDAPY